MRLTNTRRRLLVIVACTASVLFVTYVDWVTGPEIPLSLPYLPLVLIASWFGGLVAGTLIAVLSVIGLVLSSGVDSGVGILYEVPGRLAILSAIAYLAALVHQQRDVLARQSEQLRIELRGREDYMSMVAHELRNPLVAIKAVSRLLGKAEADAKRAAQLTGIAQESEAGLELLDGLTDVASIESGRLRSVLHPIDLAGVVREYVHRADTSGHPVRLHGADVFVRVLGDERRLEQVLRNLMGNAAKYSPDGAPIDVTVGIGADRTSGVVVVRDHGAGVPPGERGRLFQKFARLSTSASTRGSGLGLYISRGIARDHGGDLAADWPAGGGTVFSLTLPLAQ